MFNTYVPPGLVEGNITLGPSVLIPLGSDIDKGSQTALETKEAGTGQARQTSPRTNVAWASATLVSLKLGSS